MNESEQRAALLRMDASDCAMLAMALAFVERAPEPVPAKRATLRDALNNLDIQWQR